MSQKNGKKLGNKGFSLVELIIVIAIMAILIGIVGAAVIPYLERSREAKDNQILSGYITAAVSSVGFVPDAALPTTITIGPGAPIVNPANVKFLETFQELTGITTGMPEFESRKGKAATSITVAVSGAGTNGTGHVTVTAIGTNTLPALGDDY